MYETLHFGSALTQFLDWTRGYDNPYCIIYRGLNFVWDCFAHKFKHSLSSAIAIFMYIKLTENLFIKYTIVCSHLQYILLNAVIVVTWFCKVIICCNALICLIFAVFAIYYFIVLGEVGVRLGLIIMLYNKLHMDRIKHTQILNLWSITIFLQVS